MTMPIIAPRVSSDSPVGQPNANTPASHADTADASAPVFGSVLTLLLAHVGQASPEAKPAAATTESTAPPHAVVDAPGATGAAVASLVANPHAIAAANEHSAIASTSPLEQAADAAIDEATAHLDAVPSVTVAIAVPTVTIAHDVAHTETATRRSLDLVVPEFRERLYRVIERMESEFGYKVEVTETYRSQTRQNALYAQGRTEPGQVVTWTRASNHTAGRAADLVVDGSYDNPLAYERLMRIAREEGLRTLGPRDPGHVELPASGALDSARGSAEGASKVAGDVPANAVIARPAPSVASHSSIVPALSKLESAATQAAPNAGLGVARVATVATVAHVAQVAQVAPVAIGGQATPAVHAASQRSRVVDASASRSRDASPETLATEASTLSPTTATPSAVGSPVAAITRGETSTDQESSHEPNGGSRERARIGAAARDSAADALRQTREELLRAVAVADPHATTQSSSGIDAPATVGHTDMSERIARLLKVQDAAGDRPLSHVVLRLERPDGGEDRLRVDLRGSTVSATLDVADQAAADSLGASVKELQRALERHGFEAESLTVRSSRAMESSTLARAAGAAAESDLQRATASSPNTSTNTSSRERGARHDEDRPSPDSQRHRSRREQKGDR